MAQNIYAKRTTGTPRLDLLNKEFEDLIEDQGTRVRITPTILCPNRTSESDSPADTNHNLNCPVCSGAEILDITADAFEDWVYIQGIKLEKMFNMQGVFDMKDAFMTTRAEAKVGYWFKVEIIDFGSQFNELILRGDDDTDKTRYPKANPEDGSFFILIDKNGVRFTLDTDFTYVNQTITWLTANRPANKTLYSFMYPVLPTFRILELMHENRYLYDGFKRPNKIPVQLPQQSHIRWDFMAKRQGSDVQL